MISANTYSEVFEILSNMNKSTVMKIPLGILEIIKKNRNVDYISKIDKDDLFNLNNISEETINILAWLDMNYWISDEKKEKITKILRNESEQRSFKETTEIKQVNNANNRMLTEKVQVKVYKEKIFTRIINKIKKILNI